MPAVLPRRGPCILNSMLMPPLVCKKSVHAHKFVVSPHFCDVPAVKHHDRICMADIGKPVGNSDDTCFMGKVQEEPLQGPVMGGVHCTCRFVENVYLCVMQQASGDAQPLALPA